MNRPGAEAEQTLQALNPRFLECIHCGLCLNFCPTFTLLGTEADSPRGRIYLMRAVEEGRLRFSPAVVRHLDLCLGCRACETVCPSGVHYGALLTLAREQIEKEFSRPLRQKILRKALLTLLTRPKLMALSLLPFLTLARLTRRPIAPPSFLFRWMVGSAGPMFLPPNTALWPRKWPEVIPAQGRERARVLFLPGCVMNLLYAYINEATLRVLSRNGVTVVIPPGAGCCGALPLHQGEVERARNCARQWIRVYEKYAEKHGAELLLTNSAGCGSAMKEYAEILQKDSEYSQKAKAFSESVKDVCEFLVSLQVLPSRGFQKLRVTYHDACHLAHAQGILTPPRELLKQIPGIELVELEEADTCCGSAGIYNFTQPRLATLLLQRKVDHIKETGASVVVMGNPGCLMWIQSGLWAEGHPIKVLHTLELLDQAYETDGTETLS